MLMFMVCLCIGFNVEVIWYKNIIFTIWDLAGVDKARKMWYHHYSATQGKFLQFFDVR